MTQCNITESQLDAIVCACTHRDAEKSPGTFAGHVRPHAMTLNFA